MACCAAFNAYPTVDGDRQGNSRMKKRLRLWLVVACTGISCLPASSAIAQQRRASSPALSPQSRSILVRPNAAPTSQPAPPSNAAPSPPTAPSNVPPSNSLPDIARPLTSPTEVTNPPAPVDSADTAIPNQIEVVTVSSDDFPAPVPPSMSSAPIGSGVRAPSQPARGTRIADTPNRLPTLGNQAPSGPVASVAQRLPLSSPESNSITSGSTAPLSSPSTDSTTTTTPVQESPSPLAGDSSSETPESVQEIAAGTVPVVSLDVRGPQTLNQGQTGRYRLTLANVATDAANVVVEIGLPSNARLIRTNIESIQSDSGARFELGTLAPEETREILFDVTAQSSGAMRLTSRVLVSSEAALDVSVSEAKLNTTINAPQTVIAGAIVPVTITVSNEGINPIDQIRVIPEAPQGVRVQADYETAGMVGWLGAGESREIVLHLIADRTGEIPVRFVAEGNGIKSESEHRFSVQQPELNVSVDGPETAVLQGIGEFAVVVLNPTDLPMQEISVSVAIPAGLKITTLDRQARFDAATGRLMFTLPSLEGHAQDGLRFKAQLLQPGSHQISASAAVRDGAPSGGELTVSVNGQADVTVQIEDEGRPVSVGGLTRLNLKLKNQGSSAATGISVRVELPAQLSADSTGEGQSDGNVIFLPEFELQPGEEKSYPITVIGTAAGTTRVKAIVVLDGLDEELIDTDQVIIY